MNRYFHAALALVGAFFLLVSGAQARVAIHIDLSSQRMTVHSSSGSYSWPVSTARSGYVTPNGTYRPTSLQTMHYSRKYHMSPMPHSIFFRGGYAIHGTYATRSLGRPASHGCIRLAPGAAAALFQMVRAEGATITITGSAPRAHYAKAYKHRTKYAARGYGGRSKYAAYGHHRHRVHYAGGRHRHAPMAYAPVHRHKAWSPRRWQRNPAAY